MLPRPFLRLSLLFSLCALCLIGCGKHSNGRYKVAVDPLWYPLDFKLKENNVMGFSSELLSKIAKEESLNLSIENTNWDTLFQGLKLNSYQAVLSSLYPYNFNLSLYDFSELYLPLGPVLLLPSSVKYKSLKEMEGTEIGALVGSSSVLILEAYPDILIKTYDEASTLVNDLLLGRIQGGLLPVLVAGSFTEGSFTGEIRIASKPLNDEGLRLLTLKDKAPKLISHFNAGLNTLKKNGEYKKLLSNWRLIESKDSLATSKG